MENTGNDRGIIFDMDGTLWDSSENVAKSWNLAIEESGVLKLTLTAEDIRHVMGKTMDAIADIVFCALPKEQRKRLMAKCCQAENDYLREHGGKLYDDVEDTLGILKEHYGLYIVSNCQSGYIEAFLDHYRLWNYFADIECYGNNLLQKADNISLIMKRNHLKDAVYFGDIQGDYDAAKKAGADFIHAAYGFGSVMQKVPEVFRFRGLRELLLK